METSALLFAIVKILGAAYLVYLGIRQWNSKSNAFEKPMDGKNTRKKRRPFVQGILVAISNPKVILFFTALFPQFIDFSKPVGIQFAILTTTFMLYSFIILAGYAMAAQSARDFFVKGSRVIWFNRISGTIFITFGLGVLRMRNKATQ